MVTDDDESRPIPDDDRDGHSDDTSSLASVVVIDRREDVAGVCGRVDTAPTFAVVLHAPDGNRQLSTELGIRRLQRHAEESGKVIAIATANVALASRARQVGIPVSRRPEHVRWDAGGRRVLHIAGKNIKTPALGRYVQAVVILGVAVLFVALALTMAPSAKVTAFPPTETLSRVITITAVKDRDVIDFDQLLVPASQVENKQHFTLALKTTGKANVGTVAAKAVVAITNPTPAEITVPQYTALLAGPTFVPFELDAETIVPAGKTVTQQATAQRPGVEGNVAADTISGWLDENLRKLIVTNPEAAAGGVNADVPAVDARDVSAIKQLAQDISRSDSVKKSLLAARPHDAVFLSTAGSSVDYTEPLSPAGTQADLLLMDVDVTVKAYAVLETTLDQVARTVLRGDQAIGEFIPGTVKAVETGARQINTDSDTIKTEIQVSGEFARNVTSDAVVEAVKGKSEADAKSTLNTQYGIQDADVSVSPGWAPWLPRFSFRIGVDLRSKAAEDVAAAKGASSDASPTATATPAASAVASP